MAESIKIFAASGGARLTRWAGDHRALAIFAAGVLCFAATLVSWSSFLSAQALHDDSKSYPIRLIIPAPIVSTAQLSSAEVALSSVGLADQSQALGSSESGLQSETMANRAGAFERAFGLAFPSEPQTNPTRVTPLPKPGKNGMLAIDFNLEGGAESSRAISVKKPVAVAGAASGQLSIRIDGAAKIYANRGEVASLLEGKSDKSDRIRTASSEEFVSFTQLRDWGVDIRYDPSGDRILIPLEG